MGSRQFYLMLTTVLCAYFGNAQECEFEVVDLPVNLLTHTNVDIGQPIYDFTVVDVYFGNVTGVVTLLDRFSDNFDIINNTVVITNCPRLELEEDLDILLDNDDNCFTKLHITVGAPVADIVVCVQKEVFVNTSMTTVDVLDFQIVNVRDCGNFVCSVRSDDPKRIFSVHNLTGISGEYLIQTSAINIQFGKVYTLKLACVDINVDDIPPEAFVAINVTFTNSTVSKCISNEDSSTVEAPISSTQSILKSSNVVGLTSSLTISTAASLSNVSSTVGQTTSTAMTATPDENKKLFFDKPGNIAAISAAAGVAVLGSAAAGAYALTSKRCRKMPLDKG